MQAHLPLVAYAPNGQEYVVEQDCVIALYLGWSVCVAASAFVRMLRACINTDVGLLHACL